MGGSGPSPKGEKRSQSEEVSLLLCALPHPVPRSDGPDPHQSGDTGKQRIPVLTLGSPVYRRRYAHDGHEPANDFEETADDGLQAIGHSVSISDCAKVRYGSDHDIGFMPGNGHSPLGAEAEPPLGVVSGRWFTSRATEDL